MDTTATAATQLGLTQCDPRQRPAQQSSLRRMHACTARFMSRTDLPAYLETSVSYGNAMPCKWLKMQRFQLTAVHSIMRGQHKHWDVKLFLEQSSVQLVNGFCCYSH